MMREDGKEGKLVSYILKTKFVQFFGAIRTDWSRPAGKNNYFLVTLGRAGTGNPWPWLSIPFKDRFSPLLDGLGLVRSLAGCWAAWCQCPASLAAQNFIKSPARGQGLGPWPGLGLVPGLPDFALGGSLPLP